MQNIYQLLSFNKEVSPKRRMYPFFHSISYHQSLHLYSSIKNHLIQLIYKQLHHYMIWIREYLNLTTIKKQCFYSSIALLLRCNSYAFNIQKH